MNTKQKIGYALTILGLLTLVAALVLCICVSVQYSSILLAVSTLIFAAASRLLRKENQHG